MMPLVSYKVARNGLHAAHLHWLKGTWHGALNNLRPNIQGEAKNITTRKSRYLYNAKIFLYKIFRIHSPRMSSQVSLILLN